MNPTPQTQNLCVSAPLRLPRRQLRAFNLGSVKIPYGEYRSGPHKYWMLFYYKAGKRVRESRSTFAALKARADEIATDIANGRTAMLDFTPDDRASFLRARELVASSGKPVELAAASFAECVKILQGAASPEEACRFFMEHRPTGHVPRNVPDLVEELIASKLRDGVGKRWARSLETMLGRFAAHFTGPLHLVRAADVQAWRRTLNAGNRTWLNYLSALRELVAYAKLENYLPKTWDEISIVPAPEPRPIEIRILTPEQITRLLTVARPNLVPFIAFTAFAGIRHEEMTGEKALLDWRDVDFEQELIYVPKGVGKTGRDRVVPMPPNLVAWLKPYARRNGPVCDLGNSSNALWRAKKKAGIATGKNETRNTLRKSFISYRLAVIKNIAQVAEEAGNSAQVVRSNYRRPIPEAEGKRWFNVWPTHAEVLQLRFAI